MKNFEEFLKDVQTGSLKADYEKALGEKENTPVEQRAGLIVEFAKGHGYDVSVEDITLADADNHPLDDEELAKVSGGGKGREWCMFNYGCEFAWNTCVASNECNSGHGCKASIK